MAIPLIIGGAALAAGIFGAKKGYDAKKNYAKAKDVIEDAEEKFDKAKKRLESYKNKTNQSLQSLGAVRLHAEADILKRFVNIVKAVNHVEHSPVSLDVSRVNISASELRSMEAGSYQASDLLKDGVSALSSGVLTSIGVGGLASTFGVASTGTAVSGLTGIAATNATLAWLGGGSLAAGGMGVAGGMAVLGGAIAGPVLAVVGFTAAKKSEKALTEAYLQSVQIEEAVEQLKNGVVILKGITNRADEINQVILALCQRFQIILDQAEKIVFSKKMKSTKKLVDFNSFSELEKNLYMATISFGYALNSLLRVKVIDDDGYITEESLDAISKARSLVEEV
jgi:hypothetical protein